MSTPKEEREFWSSKATDEVSAKSVIAASEEAWTGGVLTACLELILPAIDAAPHRKGHGPRVLDVGCGIGRLTIPIAEVRPKAELTGLDISESMLALARARSVARADLAPSFVRWFLGNGRTIWDAARVQEGPEDDPIGRFDAAYSMIMFQHIPRKAQAGYFEEISTALVKGGLFRLQVMEGEAETLMHHYVTEEWLRETCGDVGLSITEFDRVRPFGSGDDVPMSIWLTAKKR